MENVYQKSLSQIHERACQLGVCRALVLVLWGGYEPIMESESCDIRTTNLSSGPINSP